MLFRSSVHLEDAHIRLRQRQKAALQSAVTRQLPQTQACWVGGDFNENVASTNWTPSSSSSRKVHWYRSSDQHITYEDPAEKATIDFIFSLQPLAPPTGHLTIPLGLASTGSDHHIIWS